MPEGVAFIEGKFVPAQEARISIFDTGFTRGDAVYDTVSVWHGRFFRLDDHVRRFQRSCAGMRLRCPHSAEELKWILGTCVHRAQLSDAYVQMIVTRGVLPRTPLQVKRGKLVLRLPGRFARLRHERLFNRVRQLARLVGREPMIDG